MIRSVFCALFALCVAEPASAHIDHIVINSTVPYAGGQVFGTTGSYEQLDGTAYFKVDPNDPANATITDLKLAPRDSAGKVEFQTDFSLLRPTDMTKSNGVLIHDVVNRGNKVITGWNIGGSGSVPGDGFLENKGYTILWVGWERDITSGIKLYPVVAKNPDGSAITGRVRSEYILNAPAPSVPVTALPQYMAVSTDNSTATLTQRVRQLDPRQPISNDDWAFANCSVVPFPGVADPGYVCLNGGFNTNNIYEIVYTAQNPTVEGLGFLSVRDFVASVRNNEAATSGLGLGNYMQHTLIHGTSQSGRWIRSWIQNGLNVDENGRKVFDGANPHISSNRGAFNVRFAQPTRLSGTQRTEAWFPGAESPSAWEVSYDPVAAIRAGQLDRCRRSNSCPKIVQTFTDTEYWQALMSLNTTDSAGQHDLPIAPEVRLYHFAGTNHGGGNALNQPPAVLPAFPVDCQLRGNSNPYVYQQRALLEALRAWVVNNTAPPPSKFPTLANHSLVLPTAINPPYVPANMFTTTGVTNFKVFLDRGPQFSVQDITGIMAEPPIPRGGYTTLVPQVDSDGNPVDGIRNTNIQAPLGTYTGWNVRKAGFGEGDSCDLTGAWIPFFAVQADRILAGDPRPSLIERYPTHQDYVNQVTVAAGQLVSQGFMLPDDATSVIAAANAAAVP